MNGRKLLGAAKRRTPSPAVVISIIALAFAVGGGFAVAKKHHSDAKSDKKIANKQITKRAPGLSVAHAKTADNANALGGIPASQYVTATQTVRFFTTLDEDQTKVVANNADFDVVAVCDADSSLTEFDNEGTALYIVQKADQHGVANTSDDDDNDFTLGEFAGFDFDDPGDAGTAVNPSGSRIDVYGAGVDDSGPYTGIGADCIFSGFALL
jgi:hypothetical protein